MSNCPDYRLRLFLSVDLAGSTAFKSGAGSAPPENGGPHQRWVESIRHFYRQFPSLVVQHYKTRATVVNVDAAASPQLWKTIGDEILFCCRVSNVAHAAVCVTGFIKALDAYGDILDHSGGHMDLKGAGWLAAFPSPNVTVALSGQGSENSEYDEALEAQADAHPNRFDFLGNGIDGGFRVARYAASDRFATSVELAYLLAEAAQRGSFDGKFAYHGRQILKGVLRDRPYPIVSIDTERKRSRRDVREHEKALTGSDSANPMMICNFLQAFMTDERMSIPALPGETSPIRSDPPEDYTKFRKAWLITEEEKRKREDLEAAAATATGEGEENFPPGFEQQLEATVSRTVPKDEVS